MLPKCIIQNKRRRFDPFSYAVFAGFSVSFFVSFLVISSQRFAFAQTFSAPSVFSGISITIPWKEPEVEEGSVIVIENGKFSLSTKNYDENIYGVVVVSTAISLADRTLDETGSILVVSSGETYVRVSSINGDIKVGDFITTSSVAGIAQFADVSGYVLGIALEDYSNNDPNAVGRILVQIDIKSAYVANRSQKNLFQFLKTGALSPIMSPLTSFRYLLSGLVVVASFIVGFSSFGKISGQSVEAMGRNPLASRDIKSAVVFNFIFTFGIMIAGIVVSYLILVL